MRRLLSLLVPSLATVLFASCAAPSVLPPPGPPAGWGARRAEGPESPAAHGEPAPARVPASGTASAPSESWIAQVSARIDDASHQFFPDGADFRADIPERGLTATFDDAGAHIASSADDLAVPIVVRVSAVGRSGASALPIAPPALGECQDGKSDPSGNCIPRLEYATDGVTEWWEAGANGLEQGWTLSERPEGYGPVRIDIAVENADATVGTDVVHLRGDDGSTLVVSQLSAVDANGDAVPVRFEREGDGFRVVVDDVGAVYPIEVDPVYTTEDWSVVADEGFAADFGYTVAGAGDVNGDGYDDVLVSSYTYNTNTGIAYLFEGSASGVPDRPAATLYGSANNDCFGFAMDGAGDVNGDGYDDVVIGAYFYSSLFGGAFVYLGGREGLTETAATTLTGTLASSYFGRSVAGAGDVNGDGYDDVAVGAYFPSSTAGAAYIYQGSASGIATAPTTTLAGASISIRFGHSVASAGDVNADGYADLIVGAPYYSSYTGRAYVYLGSGAGLNTSATSTLTGAGTNDLFGNSVSGAGDIDGDGYDEVLVGADANSSAYVYAGGSAGTATTATTTLTVSSETYGWSVSRAGDVNADGYADIVVGGYSYSGNTGHAYVYTGSIAGLSYAPAATLTGSSTENYFGRSVSGAGDTNGDGYDDVIIGASGYGYGFTGAGSGAAYVYRGSSTASMSSSALLAATDQYLGISVANAGDVNSDGYEDLIVGAYGYRAYTGAALVYAGGAAGLASTPDVTLTGSAFGDYFGLSVDGAGDTNNDGYDDVIVGAWGTGADGNAYTYDGSASGVSGTVDSTLAASAYYSTGYRVAGIGDVDNDGYDDVAILVGPGHNYVRIYEGSSSGSSTSYGTSITTSYEISAIAGAGDVNGDGYDDLIVGCESYSSNAGQAYLYKGASGHLSSTVSATLTGYSANEYFGHSVDGAGDVNNDGYADVIVGGYGYNGSTGRVYLYHGASTGLSSSVTTLLNGSATSDNFGYSVAGAGDMNADGYDDVIIGATGYGTTGGVFVYPGASGGVSSTALTTITGDESLGSAVATGDFNGDGLLDIVAGDSSYDGNAGRVNAYYGYTDGDGDGYAGADDCDDTDPTITVPYTAYADTDGDGYGDPASSLGICAATAGYVNEDTDCDDASASIHPGAAEICDAANTDEDCDGLSDDSDSGVTGQVPYYSDSDGDGYGVSASVVMSCDPISGYVASSTDCDDSNSGINPGAAEVCDASNTDEDCDGLADNADSSASGTTNVYADTDGDGYGGAAVAVCDITSGYVATSTDCDDTNAAAHPGAVETCDASNTDEDCDGLADDADPSATSMSTFYTDSDRDGYGGTLPTLRCDAASGYASTSTDCNDASSAISPAATELCDASNTDEDCDGLADNADPSATGLSTFYADSDSDGYGGATTGSYCDQPTGYVTTTTDCNDASATINPAANEVCDASNTDEDCDSLADDADPSATGKTTFYVDSDGDSYGSTVTANRCDTGTGFASNSTDCDDVDNGDHPGATETIANGDDEDCDAGEICYVDIDGDGFRGSTTLVSVDADCSDAGEALATALGDCDDTDASVHSGGAEVAGDGIDADCDGQELCFEDADDDGYRPDATTTVISIDPDCDDASEATLDDLVGDCNDADPAYNPVAVEANCADPNDYNCDGSVGYADADGDGFAACEECDDTRTAVNPDATEICNTLDDDCNGSVDVNAVDATVWYADSDGDGYTDSTVSVTECAAPDGYAVPTVDDCDDTDSTSHPDAVDIPGDGIDQDCDGTDAPIEDSGDDTGTSDTNGSGKDKGCGGCASAPDESGLGLLVLAGMLVRRRRA